MMDITWFVGIGGISLIAILKHFNQQAMVDYDKLKIEEYKLYVTIQANEIKELKLISNRHLNELALLRGQYAILKQEKACLEVAPPPKYKEDLQQPIFQKLFKKGRKALLLETHPDHGGTREAMEEVEAAFEVLKEIKPIVEKKSSYRGGLSGMQQDPFYRERMMDAAQSQQHSYWFHRGY